MIDGLMIPNATRQHSEEACSKGNLEVLKKLKPDPRDDDLSELLSSAVGATSKETIEYLLALGGRDIGARQAMSRSAPLHNGEAVGNHGSRGATVQPGPPGKFLSNSPLSC
jgi:hypothetical protein